MGTSIACAIIGVIDKEFPAAIPRGFVRVLNGPDAEVTNGALPPRVINGSNDIFNNELLIPPSNGIFAANAGADGSGANGGAAPILNQHGRVKCSIRCMGSLCLHRVLILKAA